MKILKIGSKSPEVLNLQKALTFLGYLCGKPDGNYGQKTEDAVEAFQRAHDLYADGVAGKFTFTEINEALNQVSGGSHFLLPLDPPAPDPKPKLDRIWVTVTADKIKGSAGYGMMSLRDDVAREYEKLSDKVHLLGGLVTSSGGKRSLSAEVNANRSRTSMHYVGRAFDLATDTGMRNPDKDQYIIEADPTEPRKWIVWCRSSLNPKDLETTAALAGTEGGLKTLEACVATPHGPKYVTTTATVFNFTKLAKQFGFERISGRKGFWDRVSDGNASEFWHFQWQTGLIVGKTTFGSELLRLYTLPVCQKFGGWQEGKDCIFGISWF